MYISGDNGVAVMASQKDEKSSRQQRVGLNEWTSITAEQAWKTSAVRSAETVLWRS